MVDCVATFSIFGHRCGGGKTHKEHVGDGQKQRENWKMKCLYDYC